MDVREKLEVIAHLGDHITYKEDIGICYDSALAKVIEDAYMTRKDAYMTLKNGVTLQEWIPASEPPKENGYYLCVILFSAVGNKKEYRRKILFWEDNVWIEMANCFRTVKPLYWMPMAEMPQPPKGE